MTPTLRISRRSLLRTGAAVSATGLLGARPASATTGTQPDAHRELRALERRYGARLGVYATNTSTGATVAHRAAERIAMCSTFKPLAVAAVLRDEHHCAPLGKRIFYPERDLVNWAPITEDHVEDGMTVGELCAAAIQYSDNTAANLILRVIGGPKGMTRFCRTIGDQTTRMDRWEPGMSSAVPGDPRDTTTAEAIARSYQRLTLCRALPPKDRHQMVTWLKGNTTSDERFRAGLPDDWVIADKTGTGDYGTANNVGVAWTTKGTPLVLSVLSRKSTVDAPVEDALIADAARVLARTLAPNE